MADATEVKAGKTLASKTLQAEFDLVDMTTGKTLASKTLQAEFDLVDMTTGTTYKSGHVFEGVIPAFIEAQVHFGAAKLV